MRRVGPTLGTETIAAVLDHLDSPHDDLTAMQVAGSNRKESTASPLDSICREAGLNVEVYTPPDLNDFRERIREMTDVVTVAAVSIIGTESIDSREEQPTEDVQVTESEIVSVTESALFLSRRS